MLQINGYKIHFHHFMKQRRTACFIEPIGECEKPTAIGIAACHTVDHYDKRVGRKIALERALRAAGFNRDFRTQVWSAYKAVSHV